MIEIADPVPSELRAWAKEFTDMNPGYKLTDIWAKTDSFTFRFYNQSLNHEELITLDRDV